MVKGRHVDTKEEHVSTWNPTLYPHPAMPNSSLVVGDCVGS